MTARVSSMPYKSAGDLINSMQEMTPQGKLQGRELYWECCIILALLTFGSYLSFIFFGHKAVPNPDFFGFLLAAESSLSFQLSSVDYRQLPGLGLLQKSIGVLVGGPQAELRGGWILNAILHPINIVLVWLVGKRMIGQSALWVAIMVGITPWVLRQLTDPIAETTLLFFILLTFYCISRQWRLGYLVACMATMIRYEAAVLIPLVFIMDMIACEGKREKIRVLVYAGMAGIPLAIWALLTMMNWDSQPSHYLNDFYRMGPLRFIERISSLQYINMMWKMGFLPFYSTLTSIIPDPLVLLSKAGILACFAFGTIYGLWKRRWDLLALHIFLWPYVFVHAGYAITPRHGVVTHWIVLIICVYGLQSGWHLFEKTYQIPKVGITIFQSLLVVLALAYLVKLEMYLQTNAEIFQNFMSVHYAAGITIAVLFMARTLLNQGRNLLSNLAISCFVCCLVFTNQISLLSVIKDGKEMFEFKLLADWYLKNAAPNESIVVAHGSTTGYFAGRYQDSFINFRDIKADSPTEFIEQCRARNVTYVTWDSRHGLKGVRDEYYYNKWGMENIAMLESPHNVGPYKFITQIRVNEEQFINLFRLQMTG